MFENILVPISSNFIPERAIERTKFFIDNFKSKIIFLYIAESKTVNKISMGSTHALTPKLIEDIKKEIYDAHMESIATEVKHKIAQSLGERRKSCAYSIRKGEFSDVINRFIDRTFRSSYENFNMVLLEYKKKTNLNYRIFDDCNIPIWVERGGSIKNILAITSSLSANELLPKYAKILEEASKANLKTFHYSVKERGKLLKKAEMDSNLANTRLEEDWQGVSSMEKEIIRDINLKDYDLLIIGRTCKACGFMGLTTHLPKVEIAKKINSNVLILYSE